MTNPTTPKRTLPPRPQPKAKPRPVVGSIKRREVSRANGTSYVVFRARLVDPENRDARIERTFNQKAHGGIANARVAAEKWLMEQREALSAGDWHHPSAPAPVDPSAITLAVVAEEWALTWDRRALSEKTKVGYRHILDTRVLPEWGDRRVGEITASDVQAWVDRLAETPRRPRKGQKVAKGEKMPALHPRTVARFYNVLRVTLRHAVKLAYISENPCKSDGIELPRRQWTPEGPSAAGRAAQWGEVEALIAALPEHYRLPVDLVAMIGLRAAEVWGLTRADWNATTGLLTVRQTLSDVSGKLIAAPPKTEKSARTVAVADPAMSDALTARCAAPGVMRKRIGNGPRGYPAMLPTDDPKKPVALGYTRDADDERRLLFVLPNGAAVQHSNFYRRVFRPTADALWPEGHRRHGFRFHDLRHTAGTHALAETNNPVHVMQLLGHTQYATTTDLYGSNADEAQARLLAGKMASARAAAKADELAARRERKAS